MSAYKRKDTAFNERLQAIADRRRTKVQLERSKVRLGLIARAFESCIKALRGRR